MIVFIILAIINIIYCCVLLHRALVLVASIHCSVSNSIFLFYRKILSNLLEFLLYLYSPVSAFGRIVFGTFPRLGN